MGLNHKVSLDVVIVSWNVREDLLNCVESVLASEGVQPNICIVDNASGDGSPDAVARRFPSVTVLRNQENLGFAAGANQGITNGASDFVMLLNPDAAVAPDGIHALHQKLLHLPAHAAVTPRLVDAMGQAQHSVYRFPSLAISLLLGTGVHRLVPRNMKSRLLLEGSWQSDVERDVPWAIGAVMMVRRAAFQSVGVFDQKFFMYAEDMEWCDRAHRAGWRIRFVPGVEVVHLRNRSGSQRYGADRTAAYLSSTLAFARGRHRPVWSVAFVAINGLATVGRYGFTRVLAAVRPTPRRMQMLELWRSHARFYLRRA